MRRMIAVGLACLCLVVFVAFVFYDNVKFDQFPPVQPEYYEYFGGYFGGVAGALLSFVGILLVIYNINQQGVQIQKIANDSIKSDILSYLSSVDNEIEKLLDAKLTVVYDKNDSCIFRDMVYGLRDANIDAFQGSLAALSRLVRLEFTYCEALALYRNNIDSHFIFNHYKNKAVDIYKYLEKNKSKLDVKEVITLDFCRAHIEGEGS